MSSLSNGYDNTDETTRTYTIFFAAAKFDYPRAYVPFQNGDLEWHDLQGWHKVAQTVISSRGEESQYAR